MTSAHAETEHFANIASLPPRISRVQRPAGQAEIKRLMELGLHRSGDVEKHLGRYVGQLGNLRAVNDVVDRSVRVATNAADSWCCGESTRVRNAVAVSAFTRRG